MKRFISILILLINFNGNSFTQKDTLNNFNRTLMDNLFDQGIQEVYFVKQIFIAGTSITGHKDDSIDNFCSSKYEYAFFWRQDQQTKYIVLDDCCYSDPFSQSGNMYLDLKSVFQSADTTYKNYKIKKEHSSPVQYNLYRFTKHNYLKKVFYCNGLRTANQKEELFLKLNGILNPIFYDEKVRSELCKNIIPENWQLRKN